jgi:hypothetical protein
MTVTLTSLIQLIDKDSMYRSDLVHGVLKIRTRERMLKCNKIEERNMKEN